MAEEASRNPTLWPLHEVFAEYSQNVDTNNRKSVECLLQNCHVKNNSNTLKEIVKHRGYSSERKIQALNVDRIEIDLSTPCDCGLECTSKLDVFLILRWRKKVHLACQGFSRQLRLFEILRDTAVKDERTNKTQHIVEGHKICKKTFIQTVLKISQRTYYRTSLNIRSGIQHLVQPVAKYANAQRGCTALGFLDSCVEMMGDKSPEAKRILLPIGLCIAELYKRYCRFYPEAECVKEKRFYQIFQQHFPHVTFQQGCGKFTKCNVCVAAKEILQQNHSSEIHHATRAEWDEHLLRQQTERRAYYKRRHEAIDFPNEKLSIILDGMDQSKTNIPHFAGWSVPKACDSSKLFQTHVTGVIIHGKSHYAIIDCLQWQHDSNLTLSCLLFCLQNEAKGGSLPPTLYIQMDNCCRENKNKYFLGMMAFLVFKGYIKEVVLSFLMVGHTHEDVDAGFSHISAKLSKLPAKTLPQLISIVEQCISRGMDTVLLPAVFDIKQWLQTSLNQVHNQSYPHMYRIHMDSPKHVCVKYKMWSEDSDWSPSGVESPLEIFNLDANGEQILPQNAPEIISPEISRKQPMDEVYRNIMNLEVFFTEDEMDWWDKMLNFPDKTLQCDQTVDWYLMKIQVLQKQQEAVNVKTRVDGTPLDLFMNKERCTRKVYTGKRKLNSNNEATTVLKISPEKGYLILFKDCDGDPGIGKVLEHISKNERHLLRVSLYNGHLNGKWNEVLQADTCVVDRDWIVSGMVFQLTPSGFLPGKVKSCIHEMSKNV